MRSFKSKKLGKRNTSLSLASWRIVLRFFFQQPRNFRHSLLVLRRLEGSERPEEVMVNTTPFRVQIFGLPFERITQPIAHFIENVLGRTAEVDGNTGVLWGRYLRVRVQLDLSLMLVRMLCLVFPNDDEPIAVAFYYERLADFRFTCGMMDHIEPNCSLRRVAFEHGAEVHRDFGDWIRAEGNEPFLVERVGSLNTGEGI